MMAHEIASRINTSANRDLTDDESALVREMRYNRHGRTYFMADKSMLSVPAHGEATGLGDGKRVILFPLTTVEELDDHLAFVRNRVRSREAVVAAYLDFRFARANGQFSTSSTVGAYARSGLPRGNRGRHEAAYF
jgi:hypothetical protein|nr:hypothetical protein [Neorhizobium tomejilense]